MILSSKTGENFTLLHYVLVELGSITSQQITEYFHQSDSEEKCYSYQDNSELSGNDYLKWD